MLASGLCTGFACLAAGIAIGVSSQVGARCVAIKSELFVVLIIVMIFGEALALFGLIMSLVIGGISIDESVCS